MSGISRVKAHKARGGATSATAHPFAASASKSPWSSAADKADGGKVAGKRGAKRYARGGKTKHQVNIAIVNPSRPAVP